MKQTQLNPERSLISGRIIILVIKLVAIFMLLQFIPREFVKNYKDGKFVMVIKKYFLIFAFCAVAIIALLYGVCPIWFAETFIGVSTLDPNIAHIFRAVMGLYLALGGFWFHAAFSEKNRNVAVLTTVLFAGGLVSGRLISLMIEGQPAPLLLFYLIIELTLVPIALWVYCLPD